MNNSIFDDAEEASFSLNGMLAGFDENTSAYAHMPTKNPYSHFCFAMNIKMTEEEVMPALKNYLTELERGECREVLCIEKKMLQSAARCSALRKRCCKKSIGRKADCCDATCRP